jgi:hypothetical protein
VAVVESAAGVVALGLGLPRPLGTAEQAPGALAETLAGRTPERLMLLVDWPPEQQQALCAAAQAAAPGLICERGPGDLMESGGAPAVELMTRQVHTRGGVSVEAAAAAAQVDLEGLLGCFVAAREEKPGVQGRVVLEVVLGAEGAPERAEVTRGWGQEGFEVCLAGRAMEWRFAGGTAGDLIALPLMFFMR